MNKISQIRADIQLTGEVSLDLADYNQLQKEWITRAKMEGWIEISKIEELTDLFREAMTDEAVDFRKRLQKLIDDTKQ